MLDLTKKDTLCSWAKEKHQKDGKRSAITFRIKSPNMRDSQGHKQKSCTPGPEERSSNLHKRLNQTCLDCLSVSYRGMNQQWPAMGSGALTAADLEGAMCSISPLREDSSPTIEPLSKWSTHWRRVCQEIRSDRCSAWGMMDTIS